MKKLTYTQSPLRESSSSDDTEPASFTLFPSLPKELRLAIWRFTLPRPRRIRRDERRTNPVALSINRESRQLALHHYKPELSKGWYSTGNPRYIDYSADFIHEMEMPSFGMQRIENLIQEHADSIDLEKSIHGRLQEWLGVLPRLREVLVVVHYREQYAYEPFKPTESQVEKRLQSMKPKIVDRIRNRKTQREMEGQAVLWRIPDIVMETCKPCFRRRGGRHYTNTWCRGYLK